jgi:tRNA (Thr-GGU) A37 N-methylase
MGPETFTYRRIGTIHTPFRQAEGTPIQPVFGAGVEGEVEVDPDLAAGLDDLRGD